MSGRGRRRRRVGSPGAIVAAVAVAAACGGADGAEGGGAAEGPPAEEAAVESGVAARDSALRRMAAELLPAIEERAALPARAPLRLAERSREDLEAFLRRELAEQLPAEKAEAVVRAYARFGLVPDTLDIATLLQGLLLEQVVGYYDPAADTLFVLAGVPAEQVEAVLAHEIVHALQDQYTDLDSLMEALRDRNDAATAARAALEGHATFAMLEWQLARLGGAPVDLTRMPGLREALAGDPLAAAGMEMPALEAAPEVIRESLLFPYLGGLVFMQDWWAAEPERPVPLGDNLPTSTEQVLHPEAFARETRDAPAILTFGPDLPSGWREVYADGLGELETRIFLREHLAERARADAAAAGWDGDRYRLLEGPGGEALVWWSVWDDGVQAEEFAAAAREAWRRRYADDGGRRVRVVREDVGGRAAVRVDDLPSGAPDLPAALGAVRLAGEPSDGPPGAAGP